jgi:hypothetical protein
MEYFKIMLAAFITVFSHLNVVAQEPVLKWAVEQNSSLRIEGKSNVNSFTCNVKAYSLSDTISCIAGPAAAISLNGHIKMDVTDFKCSNKGITKDLRKTLKSDKYPQITIRFISLESMPSLNKKEIIKGCVEVELAGVVKRFELNYVFINNSPGYTQLSSGHNFQFSDFNLSPPHKLLGLIKVKDAFGVSFELVLRRI